MDLITYAAAKQYTDEITKNAGDVWEKADECLKAIQETDILNLNTRLTTAESDISDIYQELNGQSNGVKKRLTSLEANKADKTEVQSALAGKADISSVPTKTSDLTNDSNFVSDEYYNHTDNNFTNAYKNQIDTNKSDIKVINNKISRNLYDKIEATYNAYVNSAGTYPNDITIITDSGSSAVYYNQGYYASDFIDVTGILQMYLSATRRYAWYDSDKSKIGYDESVGTNGGAKVVNVPENAKYIRITVNEDIDGEFVMYNADGFAYDIDKLEQVSGGCQTALFGSDKLTKLLKTAASNYSIRITSNGTLEILQGYRVFIFNVADYDSVAVVNELDSYLAFYNTATPISNNQISSESVVSVKTVTANTKATFDIPEGAVSFGVTVVHNAVNANATVVGIKDNANKDGIADLSDMTENLINPELVQDSEYQDYKRTGNIEVEPNTTYVVSRNALLLSAIYPHTNYRGKFLDENLNDIATIDTNPFTTPANCKYIYLTSMVPYYFDNYKLEKGSTYTGYVPYGLKQSYPEYYNSPFKDKKLCAVGDSITAGQASYVRGLALKTGMVVIAEQYDENTPTAIPGSTVTKYGNGDTTREDYMCSNARVNAIPQDSEIILIMGGSNDYNATIGTLDGEHDETTFYGAYQLMLDKIYARCPNADIYLCEMPFNHSQQDSHYEQRQQAIRDIAYKYGYPLLNTRAEGVNELNYTLYRQDGVHPNEAGRERLASLFAGQMKSFRG